MLNPHDARSLLALAADTLAELLAAHSQGLRTTIYADAIVLQVINAAIPGGLLGLLESPSGALRARSIKQLATAGDGRNNSSNSSSSSRAQQLPDGEHVLFLVGSVDWPKSCLPAIKRVLASQAYSKCTLCVPTAEDLWHDVAAVFPPDALDAQHQTPFTVEGVSGLLAGWLRTGQSLHGQSSSDAAAEVHTAPMAAILALSDNLFVLPDVDQAFPSLVSRSAAEKSSKGLGFLSGSARRGSTASRTEDDIRHQIDKVALNLVSLIQGLSLDAEFYSLGDTSLRIARRCAGISRNANASRKARSAMVVVLDRTLDLVSPMHHSNHLLDQLYRALEQQPNDTTGNDRVIFDIANDQAAETATDNDTQRSNVLVSGQSLLAAFRSLSQADGSDAGLGQKHGLWETFLMHESDAALQILRRELISQLATAGKASAQNLPPMGGKVTAEQLQQLVDAFRCGPQAIDQGYELVGIAESVIRLEHVKQQEHWGEIESAEKTLKLVLGGIKDSLAESNGGDSYSADEIEAEEMEVAWEQVLSSIPSLSSSIAERCVDGRSGGINRENLADSVPNLLLKHTPAPGIILAAASLLAPTCAGVPTSQQAAIANRLASDYTAVYKAALAKIDAASGVPRQDVHVLANRWAKQFVAYADAVACSIGQRGDLAHWRQLAGISHGLDGVYSPLLVRVAKDLIDGVGDVYDLVHARQGAAAAATNLLKGLG